MSQKKVVLNRFDKFVGIPLTFLGAAGLAFLTMWLTGILR
jgi:hypothetical protein